MTALFFCPENEQMCGAGLHRGEAAARGTLHLPSSCLNEVTEVGWPAAGTRVYADDSVLMPRLPRMVTRKNALDRHSRYRLRVGNERRREKYRASKAGGQ